MGDRIELVWTFPIYVLANNYTLHDDGDFEFCEETEFASPQMVSGIPHLAIFTDQDCAKQYLETCDPSLNFYPFGFLPKNLLKLLLAIAADFPRVVIDPRPGGKRFRTTLMSDMIAGLQGVVQTEGDTSE
jgi:hypothetical protein